MRSTTSAFFQPASPDGQRQAARSSQQSARWRAGIHRAAAAAAAATLAITMLVVAPTAATAAPSSTLELATPTAATHTITYDDSSFLVDGNRVNLWSGEFHYFRLPSQDLWRDILEKMRASGFNAVSLYFDWGYHSPKQGEYDFSGVRDVDKLLEMADDLGIYVIARPGPYINAEVDGGGFPGWLSSKPGATRSSDPEYLAFSDEWQHQINAILTKHQLTDGGGSIIMYQVENEYYNGNAAGQAYMQHLKDVAVSDGITVPIVGNNNGTFNSTPEGQVAVDFADSYPQGFDCSNPTVWNGVPDLSYVRADGRPLGTAEFQGGALDSWGGPGFDKCAELINDEFASVFYKNNIANGLTLQSFYMLYGGTNWGWLSIPNNYTSYDYGAAIRETRQLDPKFYENKRIGYLLQDVAPLADTVAITSGALSNSAMLDFARQNPATSAQFHVLRHTDSTSTTTESGTLSIDTGAKSTYTYDDADTDGLQYTGSGWSHVGPEQTYTADDYLHTESFSGDVNAAVTVPFTGTGISWITSLDANHSIADVYLDDVKVATVDTYGSTKVSNHVGYRATDLTDGAHTLKIVNTGTRNPASIGSFLIVAAIDVLNGPAPQVYTIPQKEGTQITLDGRESKIIVANLPIGEHSLSYSTSEVMATTTTSSRDVAVLYGSQGTDGETVLPFASEPTVTSSGGTVDTVWDPDTKTLRLNYTHDGITRVQVTGSDGAKPLLLLLADKPSTENIWQQQTPTGPVLVIGSHLLRGATVDGTTIALTGDNADGAGLEVFTDQTSVTWNGAPVETSAADATHGAVGTIPTAVDVTLPALTDWKHQQESLEARPEFNDSAWIVADKTATNSVTTPVTLPVLFADDYGFHTGSTWYRGHFNATGRESSISLTTQSGGTAGASSVWLNGTFLGSSTVDGAKNYDLPAGVLKNGTDNVLSVLTINMGHEMDLGVSSGNKNARGLLGASFTGAPNETITWRVQGVRGGEELVDTVRGPLNVGGLYGERAGWHLPGYDTDAWDDITLPATDSTPGVSWYTTTADLALPTDQDTSVGLTITDPTARQYRAQIFVNGWMVGNYINYRGPQTSFPVPNGILDTDGTNKIAIAVWNLDGSTGGLGEVALTNYGTVTSSLEVSQNETSNYDAETYAMPAPPTASVTLAVPNGVTVGEQFTAAATVSVPQGETTASDVVADLTIPEGWTASDAEPATTGTLAPGESTSITWTVTAGEDVAVANVIRVAATMTQSGSEVTVTDARSLGSLPLPPPAGANAVSDLVFASASNGWGPVERDMSVGDDGAGDGVGLMIGTQSFDKGLGTNAPSAVTINLGGQCSTFTSAVGIDAETGTGGTATFSVLVDGHVVASTDVMRGGDEAQNLTASVVGGQLLTLVVGNAGDGDGLDHGDWGNPVLTCEGLQDTVTATIDPAEPNGANGWYNEGPVTVTLSAAGDAEIEYRIVLAGSDDGDWAAYTTPIVIEDDGSAVVQFRRSDIEEATIFSTTVHLDSTAPLAFAKVDHDTKTITLSATDANAEGLVIEYSLDDGASWLGYAEPITVTENVTVGYQATDAAGNVSTVGSVTVDGPETGQAVLTAPGSAVAGSAIKIGGSGFTADTTVDLWLQSDIVPLGTVTTDANGAFTTEVTIPTDATVGARLLQATIDGEVAAELSIDVKAVPTEPGEPTEPVEPPTEPGETPTEPGETPSEPAETSAEPGGGLPNTGVQVLPWATLAMLLVAAGGTGLLVRRSRRKVRG